MIICDNCSAWQHNECMEVSENSDELPDQYFCEQCRPEDHRQLLDKVARGEKPWEERAKQRERDEEERKSRRRKGGRKGKKGRASEAKVDSTKMDSSPVPSPALKPPATPLAKPASVPTPAPVPTPTPAPAPAPAPTPASAPAPAPASVPTTPVVAPVTTPVIPPVASPPAAVASSDNHVENGQKRKQPDDFSEGPKDSAEQVGLVSNICYLPSLTFDRAHLISYENFRAPWKQSHLYHLLNGASRVVLLVRLGVMQKRYCLRWSLCKIFQIYRIVRGRKLPAP